MYRITVALIFVAGGAVTASEDSVGINFFEKKVRPVLVEHCYECHSSEAKKLRGGLYLDNKPGWSRGGDSGPALVPGKPDDSLLIRSIRYTPGSEFEMPPRQKLPDSAIAILEKWVLTGAPDPRTEDSNPESISGIDLEAGRKFRAFRPVGKIDIPSVVDTSWPINPVDHFILSKLESHKVSPADDAAESTIRRRLYVDLIGLPPETTAGILDIEKTVDSLLGDPQFGVRWARHWLDLARYADSSGGGASTVFTEAWKYRDYVIDSFNSDKPYDRFVEQQLAGDLLESESPEERYENIVATGFLVLGPRNYINDDEEAFRMDGADEQLDAVGRVFLGMSIGCARCHDHKFDPVPMEDYYALAGIFTSTETSDQIPATTNFEWNDVSHPKTDPDGVGLRDYETAYARFRVASKKYTRAKRVNSFSETALKALDDERVAARDAMPEKPDVVMGVVDSPETAGDLNLRIRGNPHQLGDRIPRGFLQVMLPPGSPPLKIRDGQSGRRELAEWITSPQNPLMARVYVNRVWAHLLGRGIVGSVDNFGVTGLAPTHPELLDWLTTWFVENGLSTKKLIRLITTSRTYGLASDAGPAGQLFGRRARRSLDAETIRDSILYISGALNLETVGRPFPDKLKNEFEYSFDDNFHRSVYLPRFRNNLPELFETFNVANPATVVGTRDLTILSPQALFLMNNPFVKKHAELAALRTLAEETESTRERIRHAYRSTLGREPTTAEIQIAGEFLDKAVEKGDDELRRWTVFQQNLFACVDFRFIK